jgi:hypothetical protein
MMRIILAASAIPLTAIAAMLSGQLDDLRQPPRVIPADAPRLQPLLPEPGSGVDGWRMQRERLRRQWVEFLGEFPAERCALQPKLLERDQLDGFVRELVRYQVEPDVSVDAYLLRPVPESTEPAAKLPAMVVFHQTTAADIRSPAGLADNPELHMGVQLARRGYVALCPRCFIFPRGKDYAEQVRAMQQRHPTWKGMARMTWDAIRAVDYLESLPYVDRARIGGIGHSLGAKEVLYGAAFDERYKVAVASEGGIGLTFSNWHDVWYLGPDIKRPDFGLQHHQLVAIIAPRAFLLLAGDSSDDDRSWLFIDAALPVYRLLGAERSIGWFNHKEGHRFSRRAQDVSYKFVESVLRSGR